MDTFGIDPRSRVHNSRITHQNFGPTRAAVAARTKTPVVTVFASDPVSSGQIESLSHPGHNVTGVSILSASIEPKRIGLMHDLLPQATAFGALLNPKTPTLTGQIADIQTAAHALGIETRRDRRPQNNAIDLGCVKTCTRQACPELSS